MCRTGLLIFFTFISLHVDFVNAQLPDPRPWLIVTGVRDEAKIARGPGAIVVTAGGSYGKLFTEISYVDPRQLRGVISFGTSGALSPDLQTGDVIVSSTPPTWTRDIVFRINQYGVRARPGAVIGVDHLLGIQERFALFARTHGDVVDMESGVARKYAADNGLPFIAIRAVSDSVRDDLPPAVSAGLNGSGKTDFLAIIGSVLSEPGQLPELISAGRNHQIALKALKQVRRALYP